MNESLKILQDIWDIISKPLFEIGGNKLSFATLALALLIMVLFLKASKWVETIVKKTIADKVTDPGVRGSVERFARYLIISIGVVVTLDTIGIDMKSLAAIGAVLMVGIGFGLQNLTQNFISGLIILLERPIKNGDMVEVKGTTGRVVDIRVRSTLIQTRDDISIIVPNSQFISEQVVNESFSGQKIRLHVAVGVAYGSDVEKVKELMIAVAENHPEVLNQPKPVVLFLEFGDSSLNFDLRFWSNELWENDRICSDLRFAIDAAFRREGITIPFPQRDIHIISSPGSGAPIS